jgi:hypothetical protein
MLIITKSIATGKATVNESTEGTFISGFDITNKFKKMFDTYFTSGF